MSDQPWGVDSECGPLHDVLLCPPDNFRWLRTSAISIHTLDTGVPFDHARAVAGHGEMVDAYRQAGVTTHFLEADPHLPYQCFARDSSVMFPKGAVVTAPHQSWRRGEYGPVVSFYEGSECPRWKMVTAGAIEGGDVIIVEPGKLLIGYGEERTEEGAANQLAEWMRAEGWEVRVETIPSRYVHIDVLVSILAPKLAAICVEAAAGGLVKWFKDMGYEILELTAHEAFGLGVNAISLGDDRAVSSSGPGSQNLNAALRARGIEVFDPDLEMFTLGGGGAHCLAQALRRDRLG